MKMHKLIALAIWGLFLSISNISAQDYSWDDFVEEMADDASLSQEIIFEDLYERHLNPININNTSIEELMHLPFLTEQQCRDIVDYAEKYAPVNTTGELMMIPSLDLKTRRYLQLFVTAGPPKTADKGLKGIINRSKSELTIRTDIPLYRKAGYKDYPDSVLEASPNKVYAGSPLYHSVRFKFNADDKLTAGLILEKDAGEKGIDYYSAYVMLKSAGILRTAIAGKYRIAFGKGLVVNTGASYGKAMTLSSLGKTDRGIRPHSSTSESGYMTGGAATLGFGKLSVSAFASWRDNDATLNSDSTVSSIKTDGLHRTELEKSKKGNLKSFSVGGNIGYRFRNCGLSLTAATTHYSRMLNPKWNTESSLYRYYNPRGTDFTSTGLSYYWNGTVLSLSGETALSTNGAIATINALQWNLSYSNQFMFIFRHYSHRYNAVLANSFGENGEVRNETGLFAGWNAELPLGINLETYFDIFRFPWLRYQVSDASYGYEGMIQATYPCSKDVELSLKFTTKSKQKDFDYENGSMLKMNSSYKIRMQGRWQINKSFSSKTGFYMSFIKNWKEKTDKGLMVSENIRWQHPRNRSKIELFLAYFKTDSYFSRLYAYESGLLYAYNMQSYAYHGIRTSLVGSVNIMRKLKINAKIGATIYFNRKTISSSTEQISQNHKEDIQIQMQWAF